MNANALKPPRTAWEIESAMWRAIDKGCAIASTADNRELVTVIHDRFQIPAFSFYRNGANVTEKFVKALRASIR